MKSQALIDPPACANVPHGNLFNRLDTHLSGNYSKSDAFAFSMNVSLFVIILQFQFPMLSIYM